MIPLTDYKSATIKVLDHFISLGHQNIGYIGGREDFSNQSIENYDSRESTFKSYLEEKRIIQQKNMYISNFSADEGYRLMKQAIHDNGDQLPTAFLVGCDSMAVGCLNALREVDIPVPERVSLIAMNDLPFSKYLFPPLSTVKIYSEQMGESAVDLLMERLMGREIAKKIVVSSKLMIRNSSL